MSTTPEDALGPVFLNRAGDRVLFSQLPALDQKIIRDVSRKVVDKVVDEIWSTGTVESPLLPKVDTSRTT